MNQSILRFLQCSVLFTLSVFLCGCASTSTNVMVRAWSSEDYLRSTDDAQVPEPEIYVFHKGEFEPGSVRDDTLLSEADFLQVALSLKEALAAQNYVNAAEGQVPDLVIAVHWGQTNIQQETLYFEMEIDEETTEEFEYEQITKESLRKNALILGTADKIFTWRTNFERNEIIDATSQERYYFVLVAYDFRDVLQKKKTIRWITQFSVDTSGTNYMDALPAMTRVASEYFGKNLKDLDFKRTNLGTTNVQFGEIEVVGVEKDKEK